MIKALRSLQCPNYLYIVYTVISSLGGVGQLTVPIAEYAVAYTDIVVAYAVPAQELSAVFGVENLTGAVYPAGVNSDGKCGVHQIAHHETSVLNIGHNIFVGKHNHHGRRTVKRV